jgi:hypothetical protein
MEIHLQVLWEVLIILARQLQKIIILNKKQQTQLLHHLTEVQIKVESRLVLKKGNINLERDKRKMEVNNNKVLQKIMETVVKITEAVKKIKTLQLALVKESNKSQHLKININN